MIHSTYADLAGNVAILMMLVLVFDIFIRDRDDVGPAAKQLIAGVVVSVIGIAVMMAPWEMAKGIVFDTRSILISITGLYFGYIPTALVVLATGVYRFFVGGTGMWTGIAVIGTSAIIGLAWSHFRKADAHDRPFRELYLFGILVHVAMLLWMLTLPKPVAMKVLSQVTLPVMLMFPFASALIGRMLSSRFAVYQMGVSLARSESILNETQRISQAGGWEYDVQSRQVYWTKEVYRIHEVSEQAFDPNRTKAAMAFYQPEDRAAIESAFEQAAGKGTPYDLTVRLTTAKGNERWVRTTAQCDLQDGEVRRVYGNIVDITDQKQMETALRESEHRFRMTVENIPDLVVIYDSDLRIQYINKATRKITGRPVGDFIGKREEEIWPSAIYQTYLPTLQTALKSRKTQELSTELSIPGQGSRHLRITYIPLVIEDGTTLKIVGITHDYTRQYKYENELHKFASYLQSELEKERIAISREIHDDLGQTLSALKLDLAWIRRRLQVNQLPLRQKVDSMASMITDCVKSVKQIITELRPGILDDMGLVPGIEWLTGQFEKRVKIPCDLYIKPEEFRIGAELSTAIFRITQEALTNIKRHANATEVTIRLIKKSDVITLNIEDDGVGLSQDSLEKRNSFGIVGMRERVGSLAGEFTIGRSPAGGVQISVVCPL